MKYLFILFFSAVVVEVFSASVEYVTYKDYKVYDVTGDSTNLYFLEKDLKGYHGSIIVERTAEGLHAMVALHLKEIFEAAVEKRKLNKALIYDDFSEIIAEDRINSLRNKEFSWHAYYDVEDIYLYLKNMNKAFSNITELIVGGSSYEGRQILGLRINTPSERKDDKPAIFIESGIHAREWITPATTTYFINQLLTSEDKNITALRDTFDWHIFPTVNPDGYHYSFTIERMWRKTRSISKNGCFGADANRNWDHNWGNYGSSSNPCDYQTYAGSKPFSEVETKTLSEYVSSIENLLGYISFHSYGQMLLVPYSDSVDHEDNYDDLIKIGKTSLKYGERVNGEKYDGPGTAAEILYKASGGSMDWVRQELGTALVFTYELRGYYFHWPAYRIPEQGEEVTQMMVGLIHEATDLGYV